ncbi:MAG: CheY-like chemotaxis protein [Alphaproteobacteria bacterium]|jgi:CheY-like chemotaxis protein
MKQRISALIVDDSETNRYLLSRQLKVAGVTHVFEQNDGSTAIDFLEDEVKNEKLFGDNFPPSVIFLDLNMPIMDGFAFLDSYSQRMNTLSKMTSVVFIYSSSDRTDDVERAMSHKCVAGFLVKGETNLEQIKSSIQSVIS